MKQAGLKNSAIKKWTDILDQSLTCEYEFMQKKGREKSSVITLSIT